MPIVICSKCGKQVPDSFHPNTDPCRCINWIEHYKIRGWKMHPVTKKVLEDK